MSERPYHHGDLRTALLQRAEQTLRESGVDGVSLRELAREVGVSHGAPRRHFQDRAALLDALAVAGFSRLAETIDAAVSGGGPTFADTLRAVALAYVRFATDNPALLELMFTSKHEVDASMELRLASSSSFDRLSALVQLGQSAGELVPGPLDRVGILLFATLHGIAALANSQLIERQELDDVTNSAVSAVLYGLTPRPPFPS